MNQGMSDHPFDGQIPFPEDAFPDESAQDAGWDAPPEEDLPPEDAGDLLNGFAADFADSVAHLAPLPELPPEPEYPEMPAAVPSGDQPHRATAPASLRPGGGNGLAAREEELLAGLKEELDHWQA